MVTHLALVQPGRKSVRLHDAPRLEFSDGTQSFYEDPIVEDFDGDGAGDLLVAHADLDLVYGCASPEWTGVVDGLTACTDPWQGEHVGSHAGDTLAAGGDLDGDGRPDALVGSTFFGADDLEKIGRAYVLTAPLGGGARSLADAHAALTGEADQDRLGRDLHGPGDLDGDGSDDVLLGASSDDASAFGPGRVYLFLGPIAPGALDPADAHTVFAGPRPHAKFGFAIDSGDLDGDGLVDLFFGAPWDPFSGSVSMVPGSTLF